MRRLFALPFLLALAAAEPRLNEIQAIGSHNSYHIAPPASLLGALRKFHKDIDAWNYTHPSLTRQLDAGLRQFELDIFADSQGGLFAEPLGMKLAALAGKNFPAFDPGGLLARPGFKVLHVPDIDCWSNAPTLTAALGEMAAWSGKNPRHLPLMILLECKDRPHPPLPTQPEPFTRERLLELEREILSIIPRERIILPDDIRRDAKTLREAVISHGWPALDTLRGKFILCLDNTDAIRDRYLEENPSLEGRLIFVSAPDARHPAAAWFKRNDPERGFEDIQSLVKAGFLVRTRSDTRAPDAAMRDKAFASGAQWISTDHFAGPEGERVSFENGATIRGNLLIGDPAAKIEP